MGPPCTFNKFTHVYDINTHIELFDCTHPDVVLAHRVKREGYPNAYGARIPVKSNWNLHAMRGLLQGYTDVEILEFMEFGWPANRLPDDLIPTINTTNHKSATDYPEFINDYLLRELQEGAIFGPFDHIPFQGRVGVSPMSTREKRDPTKRRVITDLSFPVGASVNDCIPKDTYLGLQIKLSYPTVDDLAQCIVALGPNCLIFKRDLARAFRQVPLDPGDYDLFGCFWDCKFFWDKVLVMGHRAAPYIMQRITNAIVYMHCHSSGYWLKNYIDDFVGAEDPEQAHNSFSELGELLSKVGCKEAEDKAVPPSPIVEFLGILFNAQAGTIEVPVDKLQDIEAIVDEWLHRSTCTRVDLEQLIGKLQFVASCVRPGRVFISRLLNLLRGMVRGVHYYIDFQTKKDIEWWKNFLPTYNGVSIMWLDQFLEPDFVVATDACKSGLGGVCGNEYFHFKLRGDYLNYNIAYLEVLAVIMALKCWKNKLRGKSIVMKCDNMSVVQVINGGRSRDLVLQAAMREVIYLAAVGEFNVHLEHIMGVSNRVPDWLSRWHTRDGVSRPAFRDFARG